MNNNKQLILLILDGWGYREDCTDNAIALANTPQWDDWWQNYPHVLLDASGKSVGLPSGQVGNSEVGHMHIGGGRVINQDFTRINDAISKNELKTNPVINELVTNVQHHSLHFLGMISSGGVHSHEEHLFDLIKTIAPQTKADIYLNLFLDGRDCPPKSAMDSLNKLNDLITQYPNVTINSLCGRFYAMDRDNRWQRTEKLYELLTENKATHKFVSVNDCIDYFYGQDITDEFIPPTIIGSGNIIQDSESVFFFNYRSDRARQLTKSFIDPDFSEFKRQKMLKLKQFVSMTRYAKNLNTDCVFPPTTLTNTLGEVLAQHNLKQLRIAETEKYAHVTFFLNGGKEKPYDKEERILIPSPKVRTYDLKPEMSSSLIAHAVCNAINEKKFDIIICNFANADMVGHTGDIKAATLAIESIDDCLKRIGDSLQKKGGNLLITADHGNAECMYNPKDKQAHTSHTLSPVPFLFVGSGWEFTKPEGTLADVAPTALSLLGIKPPPEMAGNILLEKIT